MWVLNPLLAVAAYAVAIATASCLVRAVPALRQLLDAQSGSRYASIDGLRGYLAFGVFIHHAVITWFFLRNGQFDFPPSNFYSQLGQASIALFFMITSFLFWGRLLNQGRQHDWRAFAISRLFRLYPLYLLVMALVVLGVFYASHWQLRDTPDELAVQLTRWLIFDRPDINQYEQTGGLISNVTWTLSYELFFYAALPLLGIVFLRHPGWRTVLLCLLGIYLLSELFGWNHSLKRSILASFLGGIGAAYWVRNPKLTRWARTPFAGGIALLALLLVMSCFDRSFHTLPLLLLSLFFCIVASGNRLFGALSLPGIRWMGEISYSTYLLHGLLLWVVLRQLPRGAGLDITQAIWFIPALAGTGCLLVLLSSLTFMLIERPGIRAGKRLSEARRPEPARAT
ncbi:acyltransferase [Pseudomonas sp. SCB32]|uniref:acyltransferase family protein n=1 Tax=Pseudomonas sp. SCB32 TaxID=2653853 RepID=UPI001264A7C0|nr:acyltransferase [Pseudomonas sp. SCB32]